MGRVNMRVFPSFSATRQRSDRRDASATDALCFSSWHRSVAQRCHHGLPQRLPQLRRTGRELKRRKTLCKAIALIATSSVAGTISTATRAASKRTVATAKGEVRQLVPMMDKDQKSKDEFMQFIGQTFDRLDVNRAAKAESAR
jgi:hypothetical protein